MTDHTCEITRCRRPSLLIYSEHPTRDAIGVCDLHWLRHCEDADPFDIRSSTIKREPLSA